MQFFDNKIYQISTMKAQSDEEIEREQKKNPNNRAEKQKEMRTIGQMKDIYTDPNEMYETLNKFKLTFKSVKNTHPKNKELQIIDFSLSARGPQEDRIYVAQPFYRNNIRRGNTIIYNPTKKQAFWGRKGLMKFFDVSQKSIKAIIESNIKALDKYQKYNHYTIFGQIENVLSCNEELEEKDRAKVHVYRLNKANGQNAQVGYIEKTDEWLISSKNVSILVKDKQDIKLYNGERYQFAIHIANAWFNIIANKNKEQIAALKKDLIGKTIIGEYCGNPDFQHLVKYQNITIYFYAAVQNNSQYTCLPPPQTFELLGRNGIPIVKNHEKSLYAVCSDFVDLGINLQKLFGEVARASIFEQEEGSVVYFLIEKSKTFCQFVADRYLQATVPIPVNYQKQDAWFHVSTLCKVKTLEYRILRKLREKLKFFTVCKKELENPQKKLQEKYGSFEKETYALVKKQTLSKPLEYYFCAAIIAFDYVYKNRKAQRNLATLTEHYLDFISVIFWSIENKRQVTPQLMADEQLHEQLRKTTWEKYSLDIVKEYPDLLQNLAPKYALIKKSLSLEDLQEEGEKEHADDD